VPASPADVPGDAPADGPGDGSGDRPGDGSGDRPGDGSGDVPGGPPVRVGLVGAGVMGRDHAMTLARSVPGAALVTVTDPDPDRAAEVAAATGCRVAVDADALLGDPGVDAVLVASPDDTHEALVLACLAAGKPVLCEKPLAPDAETALRIVRAEAASGRRLVRVGFMRRHDPGYLAMRRALDSGDLGAPLLLHCRHRNAASTPAFTSDMLLTSSATHEIDIVRWLLREEIVAVSVRTGRASRRAPAGVVDPRLLLLRTASGVLVDVEVFVNAGYGYDVRCELVGERGVHRLSPAPVSRDWRDRFAVAYRDQLRAWVGGLRRGAPDGPTAWDGYAATSVALAAVRSARSGREEAVTMADAVTPG